MRLFSLEGKLVAALAAAVIAAAALAAAGIASGDPLRIAGPALLPPFVDPALPLGTDRLGRDVLAGLLHGARTSLIGGIAAAAAAITAMPPAASLSRKSRSADWGRVDALLVAMCRGVP